MPLIDPTSSPSMGPVLVQESVDTPMTSMPMPGGLGNGNASLSNSMMGLIADERAASQVTQKAMGEIGTLVRRLSTMLGGDQGLNTYAAPMTMTSGDNTWQPYGTSVSGRVGLGPMGALTMPGVGGQYQGFSSEGTPVMRSGGDGGAGGQWNDPQPTMRSQHTSQDSTQRSEVPHNIALTDALYADEFRRGHSIQGIAQSL